MAEGHKIEDLLAQIPPHEFAAHEKCLKNIYLVLEKESGFRCRARNAEGLVRVCDSTGKRNRQKVYEDTSFNSDVLTVFVDTMAAHGVTKTPSVDALSCLVYSCACLHAIFFFLAPVTDVRL